MKKSLMIVLLVLTLALSACAAASPASPVTGKQQSSATYQDAQPGMQRTIAVNGSGQVTLSPDVAYISIGVHSQGEDVAQALSQNNDKAQAVAGSLKELGIAAEDIQTSSFNINPQQQYSPQGELTGTVYNVDNSVFVTVRDLQVLGKLLDVVVRSGANSINGITFDVLDKSKAISEARRLAIESARTQAEEIAQVAGVQLGPLQNMNIYSTNPPVPVFEGKGGGAASASAVPLSAGQLILRVEVNAVYQIQ